LKERPRMKCPKCKFDNLEGAKFCIECGHKFGEQLAIEGEQKQITVLFSDLSGYTTMSERLDQYINSPLKGSKNIFLSWPIERIRRNYDLDRFEKEDSGGRICLRNDDPPGP
jgi:hypothetical protein